MEKNCANCEYSTLTTFESPCRYCNLSDGYPNFTPKESYKRSEAKKIDDYIDSIDSTVYGSKIADYHMNISSLYPTVILENIIISNLKKEFELKEKKNMPTRNYNKMYTGRNLWKDIQPEIKDVKFSGPCTIVFWSDGDKTIVRCGKDEQFDKEKGLAMAICKKMLGTNKSKSNFNDIFKKWIPVEEEVIEEKDIDNTAFMSLKEAAVHYGVSVSTISRKIKKGEITNAVKVDGKWIIPVEV